MNKAGCYGNRFWQRIAKGNSKYPKGTISAPLLPHLPMLLPQLVRWGPTPPDTNKSPTHRFHLYDLEAGDFFDRLKMALAIKNRQLQNIAATFTFSIMVQNG